MNPARVLGPAVASNFFGTVDKAGKIHAVSITLCLKKGTPTLSTVALKRINGF